MYSIFPQNIRKLCTPDLKADFKGHIITFHEPSRPLEQTLPSPHIFVPKIKQTIIVPLEPSIVKVYVGRQTKITAIILTYFSQKDARAHTHTHARTHARTHTHTQLAVSVASQSALHRTKAVYRIVPTRTRLLE